MREVVSHALLGDRERGRCRAQELLEMVERLLAAHGRAVRPLLVVPLEAGTEAADKLLLPAFVLRVLGEDHALRAAAEPALRALPDALPQEVGRLLVARRAARLQVALTADRVV